MCPAILGAVGAAVSTATASSVAAQAIGAMVMGTTVSAVGTAVSTGIGVAQAKAQVEANQKTLEAARANAVGEMLDLAQQKGQAKDRFSQKSRQLRDAAAAAYAYRSVVNSARNIRGRTSSRIMRDLRRQELQGLEGVKDESSAFDVSAGSTARTINTNVERITRQLPIVNPAAVGLGGAFELGTGLFTNLLSPIALKGGGTTNLASEIF